MNDIAIRPATEADLDGIWAIFHPLVARGDTYVFSPGVTRDACRRYWFGDGVASCVAVRDGGSVVGMYRLLANQIGLGSHVANASFMVSPAAQGEGIGRQLGEHCLALARQRGFLAMQFNIVVSTNASAIALWQRLGFSIVGTLPGAYRHQTLGYVDAYVMYQQFGDPSTWPDPAD